MGGTCFEEKEISMVYRPCLRHVEAFPTEQNGTHGIFLRDPFRYTEATLFVPNGLLPLLQLMDGFRSLEDIQAEVVQRFNREISFEELGQLIDTLDRSYFLTSDAFLTHQKNVDKEFICSSLRRPYLADRAYPASANELGKLVDGFFVHPQGPGRPGSALQKECPAGVVIPHIDFHRGGPVYGHAYKYILEAEPADTYVVLGTSHMGTEKPFALTRKDFDTPFGPIPTNQGFVNELADGLKGDFFLDELSHRAEHSIEFQAVLLRCLFGADQDISMVPILCGSLREFVMEGRSPKEERGIKDFLRTLSRVLSSRKEKVCVIASVDLAHIGPQFGSPELVNEVMLEDTKKKDREMLAEVQKIDPEGFFRFIQNEQDQRNVCGLTPIYTMLHVLKYPEGVVRSAQLLKYDVASDPQGVVSFASLVFH